MGHAFAAEGGIGDMGHQAIEKGYFWLKLGAVGAVLLVLVVVAVVVLRNRM